MLLTESHPKSNDLTNHQSEPKDWVDGMTAGKAVFVERSKGTSRFVFVCEHASNNIPARWGSLGLTDAQRQSHIAWDPGALAVARALSDAFDAPLVHAGISRLVYDVNRPPAAISAIPERSEIHDIPGNVGIDPAERLARTRAVYIPFHGAVASLMSERLAAGPEPVLVTIHSFTPIYHGQPRAVELGVIHDADTTLAQLVVEESAARTGFDTRLNAPYSALDGVTHTLALHATPYGINNVMLELRNDLISDPGSVAHASGSLVNVLSAALARLTEDKGRT